MFRVTPQDEPTCYTTLLRHITKGRQQLAGALNLAWLDRLPRNVIMHIAEHFFLKHSVTCFLGVYDCCLREKLLWSVVQGQEKA